MSKIITPVGRLSYPHLFEPQVGPSGGDPKYSCAIIFEEGTDLSKLEKIAEDAGREKFGDKYDALKKAGKLRSPFRDDGEDKGYPEGSIFINAKSTAAPGIVSTIPGPDGKPSKITDPSAVYAGCYVRASLRAYGYDTNGNKGVAFALNNIQKVKDGDRLDGRLKAEDEFEADATEADLDDL